MSETSIAFVRRAMDQYNWEFAEGRSGVSETRALWVEEPVIVPFRAALEGIEYSGPGALDQFVSDTRETWAWLRIDVEDIRALDENGMLVTGTMHGAGRKFGGETEATVALLFEIEGGRIAAARTFTNERHALEAAGQ